MNTSMKRLDVDDVAALWLSLCHLSIVDTARLYSVCERTVRKLVSGLRYKKETALVDPAITERAKQAIESRRTLNKRSALKVKRTIPTTETLVDLMRVNGTKAKAARNIGVTPEVLATWLRLRHIEQSDYKDPRQAYRKLDADDVVLIRELAKDLTVWDIAKKFEVTITTVCDVVCKRVWGSV